MRVVDGLTNLISLGLEAVQVLECSLCVLGGGLLLGCRAIPPPQGVSRRIHPTGWPGGSYSGESSADASLGEGVLVGEEIPKGVYGVGRIDIPATPREPPKGQRVPIARDAPWYITVCGRLRVCNRGSEVP